MSLTDSLIAEFQQIHERIFELACRKNKYASKMSDSLNLAIENALENEYKTYYDLYKEKLDIAVTIDLYALKAKRDIIVPRRWRNWWSFWKVHTNDAADLTDGKIEEDAHLYYEELMEHLEALRTEFAASKKTEDVAKAAEPVKAPPAAESPEEGPSEAEITADCPSEREKPAEAWEEEDDEALSDEGVSDPS